MIFDEYFKVTAVAEYAGSEGSGQGNLFWYSGRQESSNEFGSVFKTACDDLKKETGNTHQAKGFAPTMSVSFNRMALIR